MGSKVDVSHIKKLNDRNFQTWKKQLTVVLKFVEVFDIVDGTSARPAVAPEAWDKKDNHAQAIILPLLDDKNFHHVEALDTSPEIWAKLVKMHSNASMQNKDLTMSKFFGFKIKEDDSVTDAYTEIEALARSLEIMGLKIEEEMIVSRIMQALPKKKFNVFKKSWDSEADKSMANLYTRLQKEESEEINETSVQDTKQLAAYVAHQAGGKQYRKKKYERH